MAIVNENPSKRWARILLNNIYYDYDYHYCYYYYSLSEKKRRSFTIDGTGNRYQTTSYSLRTFSLHLYLFA